ncbi:hypothetical protein V5O48_008634 [Marasmius crinis-equi]|uniref:UBA domain-containing protein n=1 Tax=Marasmius crinis-equi TaxID=585013 RepID=A0ABR3FDC1_9AGAR
MQLHDSVPQNELQQHPHPQNRHQPPGPQNELQQPQHSPNTETDSDAEFEDGQVYDSAFLKDLSELEAQQLSAGNPAAAVAPSSPSKRKLRVANNAPSYLHQEASRRANMASEPSPSSLPTASAPLPPLSTVAPAALPQDAAGSLAALAQTLGPGALARVAELLRAQQQPAPDSDTNPRVPLQALPQVLPQYSQQNAMGGLELLLASYRSNLGASEASSPPSQPAAQRSTSLPCATPQLAGPPQPHLARSASVAPVACSQPDATALPSFDKPTHVPPPASSDQHPILETCSDSTPPVSPPSPLDKPADEGKGNAEPRRGSTAPTSSSRRPGGRPTKEQAEIVASTFRDMDETLFNTASKLNSDPRSVLIRYLRRFNLGYKSNPWNHYESWARSPENVLMEMERLAGSEHDAVYQEFMKNPNRKPTVDEMRLTWPLFQAEHGEEKAKDLLAAWNSVCEMDAGFVVQSKGERKRVWEGHVRRLNNFLDMLRNVFQMHVFAIGVGGQVNTDAGLHFVYQNYESEGPPPPFQSSNRTNLFLSRETKDQYTDQEIIAMAQKRGYSIVRDPNAPPTPAANAAPSASAPPKRPVSLPPPVPPPPPPISTAGGALFQGALSPVPSSNGDADVAMEDASGGDDSSGDDGDRLGEPNVNVQKALVALLAQCNLKLGKSNTFPWLSLPKECFRRGVQVLNFPAHVRLPWKGSAVGSQKKGVKGLTPKHQRRLAAAINHPEFPLTFKVVSPIDLHTDVLPIMTFAPDSKGAQRQPIFAKDIASLDSLRTTKKKAAKRLKLENPEPKIQVPPTTATNDGRARSKATKSTAVLESDDEDELDGDDDDSDIYGLQAMEHDDEEYQLGSEQSPKRKRGGGRVNKGKGKADVDLTPKPPKMPAAISKALDDAGFTSSQRVAGECSLHLSTQALLTSSTENRSASAILGRNIPLSELDFKSVDIPGATSYGLKTGVTSYPRPQPAYAPGPSSSRQPAAIPAQKVQSIQVPAVQGAAAPTVPKAASSTPTANTQGLRAIPGAAGRARPHPPSVASTSTQALNPLPTNAVPALQSTATATTPTPQPPAGVALEMLQKFGFTAEQILALAQLGGAALGSNSA